MDFKGFLLHLGQMASYMFLVWCGYSTGNLWASFAGVVIGYWLAILFLHRAEKRKRKKEFEKFMAKINKDYKERMEALSKCFSISENINN